jgi:Fe-S cluster biosynthesis and repair protein YggX
MTHMVFCKKLQQELPGLDRAPYPGDLGQRILKFISAQAWSEWMAHQTMLINENRLNLMDPNTRIFLEKELEKFLFGDGSDKPAGYTPPKE